MLEEHKRKCISSSINEMLVIRQEEAVHILVAFDG